MKKRQKQMEVHMKKKYDQKIADTEAKTFEENEQIRKDKDVFKKDMTKRENADDSFKSKMEKNKLLRT